MKIVLLLVFSLFSIFNGYAQIKILEPCFSYALPNIDLVECERLVMLANENYDAFDNMTEKEKEIIYNAEDSLSHFYSSACSWYCGGQIDTITTSNSLSEKYDASKAHDFSIITAWIEGKNGNGEGECLLYKFPGNCPRITGVRILNGYTKNQTVWENNGRVKKLLMYYNDEPYAILNLKDIRDCQGFDVGVLGYENKETAPAWTIRFEILEVYPGKKYQDTAITELYFDGIDVH